MSGSQVLSGDQGFRPVPFPGLSVLGGLVIQAEGWKSTSPPSSNPHTPPTHCCVHLSVAECSITYPPSGAPRTENKELAITSALSGLCCSLCYYQQSATSQISTESKSEFHAQIRLEIELHLLCQENLGPVSWFFSANFSAWSPEWAESRDQTIVPVNRTPWLQGNCTQGHLGTNLFFFF